MIEKEKQNEKYDPEKLCAKELLALTFHPDKKIFKIAGHPWVSSLKFEPSVRQRKCGMDERN